MLQDDATSFLFKPPFLYFGYCRYVYLEYIIWAGLDFGFGEIRFEVQVLSAHEPEPASTKRFGFTHFVKPELEPRVQIQV